MMAMDRRGAMQCKKVMTLWAHDIAGGGRIIGNFTRTEKLKPDAIYGE
jgi:hypothetical protein